MQYQVPQFIDTEDRVVGPFSLRQFAYVGVAALICGIAYFLLQTWLFVIITIILLGAALSLAFLKVNGRPVINVITSAARFYWQPQTYIWKPEHPAPAQKCAAPPVHGVAPVFATQKPAKTVAEIASGDALHKSWQNLQTGTPSSKLQSASQFVEKKMAERYQIFQRQAGDRQAARRVDYR